MDSARIEQLRKEWLEEEKIAHIHGWDFSHIHGRYEEEEDLPWEYDEVLNKYRKNDMQLLDFDTGGGEFLLSLNHPYENTAATEGYPPNVELCKERLLPLGIDFKACDDADKIPFENDRFDIYINRHGDFNAVEAAYRPIKFYDVGAFVWFAHIIEWEFPGFSVEKCFDKLLEMQEIIDKNGVMEGIIHRYLLVTRKK